MYEELLQNMYSKSKEFDENLNRVRTLNNHLISKTEKLIEELNNLLEKVQKKDAPKKCSICLTRPLGMCLVSCGHCVCTDCAERCKSTRNRCYICRTPVTQIVKVYI